MDKVKVSCGNSSVLQGRDWVSTFLARDRDEGCGCGQDDTSSLYKLCPAGASF